MAILQPRLVLPVGRLAIQEVLGREAPLAEVVGRALRLDYHGVEADVIPLPHPSGASTWFKVEPGKTLLAQALAARGRAPRGAEGVFIAPRAAMEEWCGNAGAPALPRVR